MVIDPVFELPKLLGQGFDSFPYKLQPGSATYWNQSGNQFCIFSHYSMTSLQFCHDENDGEWIEGKSFYAISGMLV